MKTINENAPQIYVACLASYNAGILHGKWIDASQGKETVWEEIRTIMKTSTEESAEEWAIHDYQGFHGVKIDEWESIDKVCELAEAIQEHEEQESGKGEVFASLYADYGLEGAIDMLNDNYMGCYKSEDEFIDQYLEDTGFFEGVSEHIKNYFDYKSYLRDLDMNGDIFSIVVKFDEHHYFHRR